MNSLTRSKTNPTEHPNINDQVYHEVTAVLRKEADALYNLIDNKGGYI